MAIRKWEARLPTSIHLRTDGVPLDEDEVDLDEEAANLIRYQQFYQANAKVIQTGSTIMDAILGLR